MSSGCKFPARLFCLLSWQIMSYLIINMHFLVVSSMRTGPAGTCMASKRVWIIWNKSLGKTRKQKWRHSCDSCVCVAPLIIFWHGVFQEIRIWSQPYRRACETVLQLAYWGGWIEKNVEFTCPLFCCWRVFEDAFYSWLTPNFQWNGPIKQFLLLL